MPDDLAATLTGIRERSETAAKIMVSRNAQLERARASANDVPLLLAALEAVLKLHQPIDYARVPGERSSRRCSTCAGPPRWPCPEVRAITTALGEETGQ